MTKSNPRAPQTYAEWLTEAAKKAEDAAQARRLFNETAVDRILEAVGKRHWPPALNRENLTADLERAARIYSIWHLLDHQPSDRAILKRIERINSTARRLVKLLPAIKCSGAENHDRVMRLLLTAADGRDISHIRSAIEGVPLIVALSDKVLSDFRSLGWSGYRSAERWLIGDALRKIYVQNFARRFRISRLKTKPRQPSGPGIRFIVSVLSVMGVLTRNRKPYGPVAIEHYLR